MQKINDDDVKQYFVLRPGKNNEINYSQTLCDLIFAAL